MLRKQKDSAMLQMEARYAQGFDALRAVLAWTETPGDEESEVYAGARAMESYCNELMKYRKACGEPVMSGVERLPLSGHFPIDLGWDDRERGHLVSQNNRVEELGEDWALRRIRFNGRIFDRSPYMVMMDDRIVCCPAGGTTVYAFSRETDRELASLELPCSVGRLYAYYGKVLASCVDGDGHPVLLMIDGNLTVERTLSLKGEVEVYPESDVQLTVLDRDRVLLLGNGRVAWQRLATYSLSEERITDEQPLRFLQSRAWSVLKAGPLHLVSGEFFMAGVKGNGSLAFYEHVPGFNCNLMRLVQREDKAHVDCLCSTNRAGFRLNREVPLPMAGVEG